MEEEYKFILCHEIFVCWVEFESKSIDRKHNDLLFGVYKGVDNE